PRFDGPRWNLLVQTHISLLPTQSAIESSNPDSPAQELARQDGDFVRFSLRLEISRTDGGQADACEANSSRFQLTGFQVGSEQSRRGEIEGFRKPRRLQESQQWHLQRRTLASASMPFGWLHIR